MDAILQIDEQLFQQAQFEATRSGQSVRQWVEDAVQARLSTENGHAGDSNQARRGRFEALRTKLGHFRIGPTPSRDEMNER